jgi:oxygen-independent coproporphyrinogen-3 oxidase
LTCVRDHLAVEEAGGPPWLWPRAAYVHVPFCAHHCGYCDFAVVTGHPDLVDPYLDALAAELATLERPRVVDTLFLGGGTPTYLDRARLERLLADIGRWLHLAPTHEFTVEANPDTLDTERVAVLAEYGVNRVSLGAQSFQPRVLSVLERQHCPEEVARAVECARQHVAHISLDLIFGAPGQRLAEWQADLDQALALNPDHVSTYGLTYETGTRLWKQRARGELNPVGEEIEHALYGCALDVLEAAGFEHYEISNHARAGCRSRHNQVYWANEAYYGFGLGAARYIAGRRELNTRHLDTYLQRMRKGQSPTCQSEELAPLDRARETLGLQLRRSDGVDRSRFRLQTGWELDDLCGPGIARHVGLGLLDDDGTRVRLTRAGKFVADSIIAELWALPPFA